MWALWASLVATVLVCPMLVAEPMIVYLLDPELLVLAVVFGTQQGRIELSIFWLRVRLAAAMVLGRTVPRAGPSESERSLEPGWALRRP